MEAFEWIISWHASDLDKCITFHSELVEVDENTQKENLKYIFDISACIVDRPFIFVHFGTDQPEIYVEPIWPIDV